MSRPASYLASLHKERRSIETAILGRISDPSEYHFNMGYREGLRKAEELLKAAFKEQDFEFEDD